jgi:hypothetical protein
MIDWLPAVSVFRDVRPDQDGFQPSWLYVLLCLAVPAVLGVLSALLITAIGKLVGRRRAGGGNA